MGNKLTCGHARPADRVKAMALCNADLLLTRGDSSRVRACAAAWGLWSVQCGVQRALTGVHGLKPASETCVAQHQRGMFKICCTAHIGTLLSGWSTGVRLRNQKSVQSMHKDSSSLWSLVCPCVAFCISSAAPPYK